MKKGEKKWYSSVSNILMIIACIILVPILIINIWIMIQSKTNEDAVPSVFGIKPFLVLSGSMESDIHKGDLILTKIVPEEELDNLKVGEVIAFRDAENTVTTHRIKDIVEKDGNKYFITKGDANSSQDINLVALDDVEGIYIARIPGIGSMMDSLSKPTTILIVVLGITVIFVIGYAISNKKIREEERKEFLEFKKMKEEMEVNSKTKKTKSIKAEEDEELLKEEGEKPQAKKKASTTTKRKPTTTSKKKETTTTKKSTSASKKTKSSK